MKSIDLSSRTARLSLLRFGKEADVNAVMLADSC